MRPISNVVDASNYVLLELGKPIHTFDAAAVHERHIVVRRARDGERLETLDHVARELRPRHAADRRPRGPLAIAGVMGGAASEVGAATDRGHHRVGHLRSGERPPHGVPLLAAQRGQPALREGPGARLARLGADRTAALIASLGRRPCGGRRRRHGTGRARTSEAAVPAARVSRLLGIDVSADEQRSLLARVEVDTEKATASDAVPLIDGERPRPLTADEAKGALVAIVPTHRPDLRIEADIAEEIARVRGYETVPAALPVSEAPPYRADPRLEVNRLRALLSGRGVDEVITFALVSADDHERLGLPAGDSRTVRAANPVSSDHAELRRSLLPGLLRVLSDNERQRRDEVRIFEMGDVHLWVGEGSSDATATLRTPDEHHILGVLMAGSGSPPLWQEPARPVDLGDLKGLLEATVERLAPGTRLLFAGAEPRPGVDHPGRVSTVLAVTSQADGTTLDDPLPLGRVGELHPRLLEAFEVRSEHVVSAELDLAPLLALVPERRRVELLERLPALERDIALVVKETAPAGDIAEAIREVGVDSITSVVLFDRYQGPPLAADEVNIAFRLRFQARDSAFSEAALDRTIDRLRGVLAERFGARLRD